MGGPSDPRLRSAIAGLSAWAADGAHRRDLDRNGTDENGDQIALMDAWWPRLVKAMFGPALGDDAYGQLSGMLRPASVLPGDAPSAPDYADGWWGYVSKDLRDLYAPAGVQGPWSRVYCGGGSKTECRKALVASLRDALDHVDRNELYGKGDCASHPDPACYDQNRPTVAAGVSMPPFPFQNRPTFQQTVSVTQHAPR
jgi:hypothetical protein